MQATPSPVAAHTALGLPSVEDAIDLTGLRPEQNAWMKGRWLEQVRWFERKARAANRWHEVIRVTAITGGVLVPAFVSLDSHTREGFLWSSVRPTVFVLSLLVAVSVGLDQFFNWGERWRHYRRTAEFLKIEGWSFIERAGEYQRYRRHANFHEEYFPLFATRIESAIHRDVEVYLTRIIQERPEDEQRRASQDDEQDEAKVGAAGSIAAPGHAQAGPGEASH